MHEHMNSSNLEFGISLLKNISVNKYLYSFSTSLLQNVLYMELFTQDKVGMKIADVPWGWVVSHRSLLEACLLCVICIC